MAHTALFSCKHILLAGCTQIKYYSCMTLITFRYAQHTPTQSQVFAYITFKSFKWRKYLIFKVSFFHCWSHKQTVYLSQLVKTLNYRLSWMQRLSAGALDYVLFNSNHQQNEAGGRRSRWTRCKDPSELHQRVRKKLKESLKITGILTTNPLW